MAVMSLTTQFTSINSVDESANIKSSTLTVDVNPLDVTDFASAGWVENIGGLKSGTLAVEFQDDIVAAAIDTKLWAILGTVVPFEVRLTSAVVGASNPKWTGSIFIGSHSVGGSVGDLAMKSLSFPTSGAVTRAVA